MFDLEKDPYELYNICDEKKDECEDMVNYVFKDRDLKVDVTVLVETQIPNYYSKFCNKSVERILRYFFVF